MTRTPTTDSAAIAAAIKGRLRGAKITDEAAAAAIGVDRSTLNRKLNGRSRFVDVELLDLARLLDIDLDELVAVGGEAA